MTREEAIDKVRKLLELAKSSNPNESAAAVAQAQRIMDKYNISASDAESTKGPSPDDEIVMGEETIKSRRPRRWLQILVSDISSLNGVFPVLDPRDGRVEFYGRKLDIDCALYMIKFVLSEMAKHRRNLPKGKPRMWYESWRLGFVNGVITAIKSMREQMDANDLVVLENSLKHRRKKARDFLLQRVRIRSYRSSASGVVDHRAYEDGRTKGESVKIGKERVMPQSTKALTGG